MSWEDIIKNQELGVKQTLTTNLRKIPKDEKKDCIKWLRGLYDLIDKNNRFDLGYQYKRNPGPTVNKWGEIPEELTCVIKNYIENKSVIDTHASGEIFPYDKYDGHVSFYFVDFFEISIAVYVGNDTILHMEVAADWDEIRSRDIKFKRDMFLFVHNVAKYCGNNEIMNAFEVTFFKDPFFDSQD